METNVNYTLVGAFVIILTAALVMGIIWLSAGLSLQDYTTYEIFMKEAVTGLSSNAPVEYNGVNVGNVKSIKINHKNPRIVILHINVKSDTPITEGTRAKLDIRSLSGIAYIALVDNGSDMRPLHTQPGHPYPIINTTPSIFLRIDAAISQLNDSFHQISNSIKSVLDPENLRSIKETLKNLSQASKEFPVLLQTGRNTLKIIDAQTLPVTNQAILNLNDTMNNLNSIAADIKQNPAILIRGRGERNLGPGEK